jgi:hypothetical protein
LASAFNDIFAIVTTVQADVFCTAATGLLEGFGIEYSCCGNVYAATAELARRREGKVFVIGSLCELSKEGMRLFHICSQRSDTRCFCFVGSEPAEKIFPALREGVAVANDVKELEHMISASLQEGRKRIDQSVHLSKEELDVVLGV